jgi:hypothetical protein
MDIWKGKISCAEQTVNDVHLFSGHERPSLANAELSYISRVEVSEVPLLLVTGPSYQVWTSNSETEEWFSQHLLHEPSGNDDVSWFDGAGGIKQSYTGVLVKINHKRKKPKKDENTELLFYGVIEHSLDDMDEPVLKVLALPLSSHRTIPSTINVFGVNTPIEQATDREDTIAGLFLSDSNLSNFKANQVRDVFESANELRRTVSGRGGVGVQAAAAALSKARVLVGQKKEKVSPQPISKSEIQRPVSRAVSQFGQGMIRRSPSLSLSHSRKPSQDNTGSTIKHESQQLVVESTLDQRNKDLVARLVMTAMRLYGLQPPRKSAREQELSFNDEYKTVYYNTYKAVVFTYVSTTKL